MQQYLKLLEEIQSKGIQKPPARKGMPGSQSLFGYHFRHDLSTGFPLLTTKKMFWKGIVHELIWFLRGDTNIKYLVDNGVNIWNEDVYNYYRKLHKITTSFDGSLSLNTFIGLIKDGEFKATSICDPKYGLDYKLGDCGYQYGKVWRNFGEANGVDQLANLIDGLKKSPESRRHIVTAIDPTHDKDLALYWCHAMFQFNCRPLTFEEREARFLASGMKWGTSIGDQDRSWKDHAMGGPRYRLDCHLYQRSADAVLGVPFNIASYALLTHLIAWIVGMIPGDFIHSFGDVHIYDNHKEAVTEQLQREPIWLPTVTLFPRSERGSLPDYAEKYWMGRYELDDFLKRLTVHDFRLDGYQSHESIKAELSTGTI